MKPTFDTLRGHESHPHCHDTVLWYAVTLQVCTHVYSVGSMLVTSVPVHVFETDTKRSMMLPLLPACLLTPASMIIK
jgi:hypothetical protein